MGRHLRVIPAALVKAFANWIDQRAASKGAALAFYTLFSLAPILVLAVTLAGQLYGEAAAQGKIFAQAQMFMGPLATQAIQALLAGARDPVAGVLASTIAGLLLLFGASSVFVELKGSLDELWGVDGASRSSFRSFIWTRLLSFMLVAALAFLLLLSLLASAFVSVIERVAGVTHGGLSPAFMVSTPLVSFALIVLIIAALYKILSDGRLGWSPVWVGALFTAGLFTLGKIAIGQYLRYSAVSSSFGAAGTMVAFLVWVYYSAQIFYFGAAFTRQYAIACLRTDLPPPAVP